MGLAGLLAIGVVVGLFVGSFGLLRIPGYLCLEYDVGPGIGLVVGLWGGWGICAWLHLSAGHSWLSVCVTGIFLLLPLFVFVIDVVESFVVSWRTLRMVVL